MTKEISQKTPIRQGAGFTTLSPFAARAEKGEQEMSVNFSPSPKNLVWKHFRKVDSPPGKSTSDAHTAPLDNLKIPNKGGIIKVGNKYQVKKINVMVNLNLKNTWVVKGKESKKLLEHERRHWMMDIIVGYEIERAVLALSNMNAKILKQKILSEFNWHRNKREKWLSELYDKETKSGTDAKIQAQWEKKVDKWFADKKIPLKTPR